MKNLAIILKYFMFNLPRNIQYYFCATRGICNFMIFMERRGNANEKDAQRKFLKTSRKIGWYLG